MLWIIFAVMTAAAALAVLWPLVRKSTVMLGGSDRLIYQDQLQEIERDRTAGLIGEAEAESARVEISRRLLAAADAEASPVGTSAAPQALGHRRAAAIGAIVILPCLALGLYLKLGSSDIPGQSAFARSNVPPEHQSIVNLVSQVEAHLARDPTDGRGWEVLAPIYLQMGRVDDAVAAWRKAIALNGDTPEREADLGEALVAAANGVVTDDAKAAFQRAVAGNAHEAKARYFLGLADEQDGNREGAAAKWRALLQDAPPDAPWINFIHEALARVTGNQAAASGPSTSDVAQAPANGPSASDVAAAASMPEAQRDQMIRGMVQRLADRLHADGSDVEGWLRLVRAYVVLGDRDKAKDAAADARRALSARPDEVKRVDDLVKDLGLQG